MKKIAHISDLHFGANDAAVVEGLVADIQRLSPDLVAVSGDLTQRASSAEFRAARAFLRRLPRPVLVTPGNHDVPLWDVFRRFASPLARFQKYVTRDLAPFHKPAAVHNPGRTVIWHFVCKDVPVSGQAKQRCLPPI